MKKLLLTGIIGITSLFAQENLYNCAFTSIVDTKTNITKKLGEDFIKSNIFTIKYDPQNLKLEDYKSKEKFKYLFTKRNIDIYEGKSLFIFIHKNNKIIEIGAKKRNDSSILLKGICVKTKK